MKCASVYSLAALAALASAQSTSTGGGLPKCATSCVAKFSDGSAIAGCGQLDIKCICSNSSFLNDIACCLEGVCEGADKDAAVTYAQTICGTANVDVPDKVTCNTTSSAAPTASETGGSSSSSTAAPTGGSGNSTASKTASGAETKPTSNAAAAGGLVGVGAAALALMLAL